MQIEGRARSSKGITRLALVLALGCGALLACEHAAAPEAAPGTSGEGASLGGTSTRQAEASEEIAPQDDEQAPAEQRREREQPAAALAAEPRAADPLAGPAERAPRARYGIEGGGAGASAGPGLLGTLGGRGQGDGAFARAGGAPPRTGATASASPSAPPPPARIAAAVAPQSARPLPQSGVLASTFVGGGGAQARLEDLLDRGVMVGGQHVRLEAFDDLGRLPYAVPREDAVALYADLERARLVAEGERVHLQIALMARQGELPARPRMDVRLVIDRSGSMNGDKWANAIAAAHALVDRLSPGDTFGLVSYSDEATIDLRPARVGDRRAAHAAIGRLAIGGGTNIDAALEAAASVAPERRRPSDVLMVVLLSDGVANIGQTNPDMIAARARSLFDASGILTTTLGVGTDFDETTMLSIAREGSGSYHFVRRSEDIARILTDELEERAQAVAQDLRLRIELAPGVVATRVYGSRVLGEEEAARVRATEVATDVRLAAELGIARDRQHDDERGLRMHFPTFRRGDQHVVLMELEVPPGTDPTRIARVSLDWKDLVRERNDHAAIEVRAERTGDREQAIASTSRQVKRTVLAFQAGDALQSTADALDRGDYAAARLALSERIEVLRAARDLWRDRGLDDDLRILEQYERVVASAWPTWDSGSQRTLVMAMNFYGDRRMR